MTKKRISTKSLFSPRVSFENEFEICDAVKKRVGVPIENCAELNTFEAVVEELDDAINDHVEFIGNTMKKSLAIKKVENEGDAATAV